ncbi:MAG: DUF1801 domain-containing protein [Chloroflexota bacterium]|nr:DUF1801 domain-containing protein [Chloroflexota bacterium]
MRRAITPSKVPAKAYGSRADFGAVAESYFAQQQPDKRALLEKLHAIVLKAVPNATAAIKWGVPVYEKDGKAVCALASFKEHVGINFFAPPTAFVDPQGKLEGGGKVSRMLKVRSASDIDSASIRRWLKAAVASKS